MSGDGPAATGTLHGSVGRNSAFTNQPTIRPRAMPQSQSHLGHISRLHRTLATNRTTIDSEVVALCRRTLRSTQRKEIKPQPLPMS